MLLTYIYIYIYIYIDIVTDVPDTSGESKNNILEYNLIVTVNITDSIITVIIDNSNTNYTYIIYCKNHIHIMQYTY